MLFDLSGKRRRVVQVVYATLAILMGSSLVLLGIGSDAPGGILDALGLGGNSSGSTSPQYEQEIEDAESALEADPKDRDALLDLVHYHYLSAQEGVETDVQTGAVSIQEEASQELAEALDAWNTYLETDPQPIDADTAGEVAQIQGTILHPVALTTGDAGEALAAIEDAAEAQELAIRGSDSAADYAPLADYLYLAGRTKEGDAAAAQAVKLTDPSSRKQIEKILEARRKQALEFHDQLAKLAEQGADDQGGAIEDPFGGLGGASGAAPAPAPAP